MRLTPIDRKTLGRALAHFASYLAPDTPARAAFDRIVDTNEGFDEPHDTQAHRQAARDLVTSFGIQMNDAKPATAFSWDGEAISACSEASVLIHELAHWQIVPPSRRGLVDFGLGAGPETGYVTEADAARCTTEAVREHEELMASMLGILWEATLGHPAIHAFIEQNWLETWERPAAGEQFQRIIDDLVSCELIDTNAMPYPANAATAEISIRNSGQASAETSTIAEAGPSAGK